METPAEKRAAFIKKAEQNKANFELHKKLISEVWGYNGINFVTDEQLLRLMDYAEQYATLNHLPKRETDHDYLQILINLIEKLENSVLTKEDVELALSELFRHKDFTKEIIAKTVVNKRETNKPDREKAIEYITELMLKDFPTTFKPALSELDEVLAISDKIYKYFALSSSKAEVLTDEQIENEAEDFELKEGYSDFEIGAMWARDYINNKTK